MAVATRILKTTGVAGAVVAAVFLLFASVFAATGQAPAAMVFRPPSAGPVALPDGVKILRWGEAFAVVTGESPDYVRKLYASGALLVLPFRKSGCLAFRPA